MYKYSAKELLDNGLSIRKVAKEMGMSASTVQRIKQKITRRNVLKQRFDFNKTILCQALDREKVKRLSLGGEIPQQEQGCSDTVGENPLNRSAIHP